VEYVLTQRGKTVELIGSKLMSAALHKAGSIVQDPKGAKLLADMANMASANPEMFQIITDWALNIGLLTTSDPVFESRWLQVLAGDREAWHPFEEEINKRASTAQPKTLDELKEALDDIQQGIRKVFEAQKIKRSKK